MSGDDSDWDCDEPNMSLQAANEAKECLSKIAAFLINGVFFAKQGRTRRVLTSMLLRTKIKNKNAIVLIFCFRRLFKLQPGAWHKYRAAFSGLAAAAVNPPPPPSSSSGDFTQAFLHFLINDRSLAALCDDLIWIFAKNEAFARKLKNVDLPQNDFILLIRFRYTNIIDLLSSKTCMWDNAISGHIYHCAELGMATRAFFRILVGTILFDGIDRGHNKAIYYNTMLPAVAGKVRAYLGNFERNFMADIKEFFVRKKKSFALLLDYFSFYNLRTK